MSRKPNNVVTIELTEEQARRVHELTQIKAVNSLTEETLWREIADRIEMHLINR